MNDHIRPDVTALGRIVTVWAHPDDESYLAGGLMTMARCLGQPVTCITATPGDFASSGAERARIGRIRTDELTAALAALGVQDGVMLGLRDGSCQSVPDEFAVERIAAVLCHRRPDTIITFGPDGFTGHADHRAVSRWTTAAAARACPDARLLFPTVTAAMVEADRDITGRFPVFDAGLPDAVRPEDIVAALRLSGRWLDTKMRALRAHASQTAGLIEALGSDRYRRWNATEQFVAGPVPARAARVPARAAAGTVGGVA